MISEKAGEWNVFDKDDDTTWPTHTFGWCWVQDSRNPETPILKRFTPEVAGWWGYVTHWTEISVPEVPKWLKESSLTT